jgi:hypothetical protein
MLSEPQMETVITTADDLPAEKRGLFIKRVAARLQLNCSPRLTDADLDQAVRLALQGLSHPAGSLVHTLQMLCR